jgi:hypothetical protein
MIEKYMSFLYIFCGRDESRPYYKNLYVCV